MACPDDEILLALLEGRLDGDSLAATDVHLDGCESCRDLVATLASGVVPKKDTPTRTRLGRFELRESLGEGAMGTVHVAYDPELDREIAIKRLRVHDDATQRARLLREAQALARLAHPNVVTIFDVGVEDDTVYLAMELVRGSSLRPWLSITRPPVEALATLIAAGRGLAAAHAAGIVHRDFKPENVLLGDDGRVKVVDFGLAHEDAASEETADLEASMRDASMLRATLTGTGALIGTPAYMAPEQIDRALARDADARRASSDARADQFAFAVTAWEAIEGARPFSAAQRITELRAAIEAGPPTPKRMSRSTHEALRRAMSPRAADRFPSMDALLAALAPKATPSPWRAAGALVLGVGVLGVVAYASRERPGELADPCVSSRRAIDERIESTRLASVPEGLRPNVERWRDAWTEARVDACEATHVRREQSEALLDARVQCLDRAAARASSIVDALTSAAGLASAPELLASLPEPSACSGPMSLEPDLDDDARAAAARNDRAAIAIAAGDPASALEILGEPAADTLLPSIRIEAALLRASALRAGARYDEALIAARSALFVAEDRQDPGATSRAWLEILRVLGASGRYVEAREFLEHAEAARARARSSQHDAEAFLRVRATIRIGLGDLAAARSDLDEAARTIDTLLGPRSLERAVVHASLGNLARLEARFDDALREHEQALSIDEAILGDSHPRVGRDLHNVAGILRRLGRLDEATARYERALAIAVDTLGARHPEAALTRNSLGLVAFDRDDLACARALWEEALPDLLARDHGDASLVHHNLALLELAEGHADAALVQIRAALAIDRARVGVDAKRVASEDLVLGRALAALDRRDEAREALLRTIESAQSLREAELEGDAREELARMDRAAAPERASSRPREPGPSPSVEPAASGTTTSTSTPPATTTTASAATPTTAADSPPTPTTPEPSTVVDRPDAAVAPTYHPSGSGAYGARVPWE